MSKPSQSSLAGCSFGLQFNGTSTVRKLFECRLLRIYPMTVVTTGIAVDVLFNIILAGLL